MEKIRTKKVNQTKKKKKSKSKVEKRELSVIVNDFIGLYKSGVDQTVAHILAHRAVTREVYIDQKMEFIQGRGLKHDPMMMMMCLNQVDQEKFFEVLPRFIQVGSWKDFFELLETDLGDGWDNRRLDWKRMVEFMISSLKTNDGYIKKYLPHIRSISQQTTQRIKNRTIIAKFICNKMFGKDNYEKYRRFKASGDKHEWQQLISQQKPHLINFSTMSKKALINLGKSKFAKRQGIEVPKPKFQKLKTIPTNQMIEQFLKTS